MACDISVAVDCDDLLDYNSRCSRWQWWRSVVEQPVAFPFQNNCSVGLIIEFIGITQVFSLPHVFFMRKCGLYYLGSLYHCVAAVFCRQLFADAGLIWLVISCAFTFRWVRLSIESTQTLLSKIFSSRSYSWVAIFGFLPFSKCWLCRGISCLFTYLC